MNYPIFRIKFQLVFGVSHAGAIEHTAISADNTSGAVKAYLQLNTVIAT